MDRKSAFNSTIVKWLVLKNHKYIQTILDHLQYIVSLRDNIFMCLKSTRAYKDKVLIGTAATYAYVAIS